MEEGYGELKPAALRFSIVGVCWFFVFMLTLRFERSMGRENTKMRVDTRTHWEAKDPTGRRPPRGSTVDRLRRR